MTQKVSFTKEAVIRAAFELTREKGWVGVTARNIARKLGSSTMPIYSSMKSMEEIEREVRAQAEALLLDYQRRPFTDDAAENKAVGYVAFARDEKNLFHFIYVDRPVSGNAGGGEDRPTLSLEDLTTSDSVPSLADQTRVAMQDRRILKSWIFTHGLASMIGSGVLHLPDVEIKALLEEAGGAFFTSEARINEARRAAAREEGGNVE
jgi:AcrR family transcriptional regulator